MDAIQKIPKIVFHYVIMMVDKKEMCDQRGNKRKERLIASDTSVRKSKNIG